MTPGECVSACIGGACAAIGITTARKNCDAGICTCAAPHGGCTSTGTTTVSGISASSEQRIVEHRSGAPPSFCGNSTAYVDPGKGNVTRIPSGAGEGNGAWQGVPWNKKGGVRRAPAIDADMVWIIAYNNAEAGANSEIPETNYQVWQQIEERHRSV